LPPPAESIVLRCDPHGVGVKDNVGPDFRISRIRKCSPMLTRTASFKSSVPNAAIFRDLAQGLTGVGGAPVRRGAQKEVPHEDSCDGSVVLAVGKQGRNFGHPRRQFPSRPRAFPASSSLAPRVHLPPPTPLDDDAPSFESSRRSNLIEEGTQFPTDHARRYLSRISRELLLTSKTAHGSAAILRARARLALRRALVHSWPCGAFGRRLSFAEARTVVTARDACGRCFKDEKGKLLRRMVGAAVGDHGKKSAQACVYWNGRA
jgi:hypothetical protein